MTTIVAASIILIGLWAAARDLSDGLDRIAAALESKREGDGK